MQAERDGACVCERLFLLLSLRWRYKKWGRNAEVDGCKKMGRNRRITRQEEQYLNILGERRGLMDAGKELCLCACACARVRASLCAFVVESHRRHTMDLLRLPIEESCVRAYVCAQVCVCLLVEITGITVLELLRLHRGQSLSEICKSSLVICIDFLHRPTRKADARLVDKLSKAKLGRQT